MSEQYIQSNRRRPRINGDFANPRDRDMTITDAMVEKALSAWFSVKPSASESDAVLKRSMRAALETVVSDQDELAYILDAVSGSAKIRLCVEPDGGPDGRDTLLSERHRFCFAVCCALQWRLRRTGG
jgi:hypothetical protein